MNMKLKQRLNCRSFCLSAIVMIAAIVLSSCLSQGKKGTKRAREIWAAVRQDQSPGTGTENDPFNVQGADGLDKLFEKLTKEFGEDLEVNVAPGTYHGTKQWELPSFWTIRGAGIDKTIFKTWPNPESIQTIGFRSHTHDSEVSDITFDFNIESLRNSNRVFLHKWGGQPVASYFYSENLEEWTPGKDYFAKPVWHSYKNVAKYKSLEYIAVATDPKMATPEGNQFWRRLYPNDDPAKLAPWDKDKPYEAGVAVSFGGKGWLALWDSRDERPSDTSRFWEEIRAKVPPPTIYTVAVFVGGKDGENDTYGRNKAKRLKAINCNGSAMFDREDFVIGLGGDNCLIEDCIVETFHGDYATLICIYSGVGSKVSGCKVYGNGKNFAYGGWGIYDGLFENNYSENCDCAVNIDSLGNRNVTFRNNIFRKNRGCGILVNVSQYSPESELAKWQVRYKGELITPLGACMDGLLIENNIVEMIDGAPYGAAQVQAKGLHRGIVRNNTFIKTFGPKGALAVGVYQAQNVEVLDNLCEPNMHISIESKENCRAEGNHYLDGSPVSLERPFDVRPRIDICGENGMRLESSQNIPDVTIEHPPWEQSEKRFSSLTCSGPVLNKHQWQEFKVSFIPDKDGAVAIVLKGPYHLDKDGKIQIPAWVCFDGIEIDGATLVNGDLEELKQDGTPESWDNISGAVFTKHPNRAYSGHNYVRVWEKAFYMQNINVKKGQLVTIRSHAKQPDDSEIEADK
jgi:hypothetical protein